MGPGPGGMGPGPGGMGPGQGGMGPGPGGMGMGPGGMGPGPGMTGQPAMGKMNICVSFLHTLRLCLRLLSWPCVHVIVVFACRT